MWHYSSPALPVYHGKRRSWESKKKRIGDCAGGNIENKCLNLTTNVLGTTSRPLTPAEHGKCNYAAGCEFVSSFSLTLLIF